MKWIKHDTDANQDNKLQNVLLDYGLEGYGLYWYCIELIGSKVDKDNITFELEHDARVIARNTGSTPQKVEEMMRDGFALLAMGFTGSKAMQWKIKYINAFNAMESALKQIAPTFEVANQIVKKAEHDKNEASEHGSGLARYRKIKKENQEALSKAIKSAQLVLGFDIA